MTLIDQRIAENVAAVRAAIADAAGRAGRAADDVKLVAVVKYVGEAEIRALVAAGCRDLGESRPQQLWQRAEALSELGVRWHLIGHLQRNKIRRTLPSTELIHSGDSLRLIVAIDGEAASASRRMPLLIEVNISGDEAKHGFGADEIAPLLPRLAKLAHVEIRGMMAMASRTGGREQARRDFAQLRALRDQLRAECPEGISLDELSMGMSGDFDIAIEEGATIVRVGSALFAGIES